jgi:hypothetical protein
MTDKKEEVKPKKVLFEVITTYRRKPQDVFRMSMTYPTDKPSFLANILPATVDDAQQLVKLSTCMIVDADDATALPAFLAKCDGKFYFNTDMNRDADTLFNAQLLEIYIKLLRDQDQKKKQTEAKLPTIPE